MTGYLAMVGLHGDHSIERDKELDLEMEKIEFRPFFIDENERFYLPPGVYLHEGTSTFHSSGGRACRCGPRSPHR